MLVIAPWKQKNVHGVDKNSCANAKHMDLLIPAYKR